MVRLDLCLEPTIVVVAQVLGELLVPTRVRLELFGHALKRKNPPLVTRYSVWLMGRQCFFSSDKARRELGWKPTVGYDEGIEKAVRWCLDSLKS